MEGMGRTGKGRRGDREGLGRGGEKRAGEGREREEGKEWAPTLGVKFTPLVRLPIWLLVDDRCQQAVEMGLRRSSVGHAAAAFS